eukprot:jgi/Botrbrau1/10124/Bobra.20_2s0029.1
MATKQQTFPVVPFNISDLIQRMSKRIESNVFGETPTSSSWVRVDRAVPGKDVDLRAGEAQPLDSKASNKQCCPESAGDICSYDMGDTFSETATRWSSLLSTDTNKLHLDNKDDTCSQYIKLDPDRNCTSADARRDSKEFWPAMGYDAVDPDRLLVLVLLDNGHRRLDKQDMLAFNPNNLFELFKAYASRLEATLDDMAAMPLDNATPLLKGVISELTAICTCLEHWNPALYKCIAAPNGGKTWDVTAIQAALGWSQQEKVTFHQKVAACSMQDNDAETTTVLKDKSRSRRHSHVNSILLRKVFTPAEAAKIFVASSPLYPDVTGLVPAAMPRCLELGCQTSFTSMSSGSAESLAPQSDCSSSSTRSSTDNEAASLPQMPTPSGQCGQLPNASKGSSRSQRATHAQLNTPQLLDALQEKGRKDPEANRGAIFERRENLVCPSIPLHADMQEVRRHNDHDSANLSLKWTDAARCPSSQDPSGTCAMTPPYGGTQLRESPFARWSKESFFSQSDSSKQGEEKRSLRDQQMAVPILVEDQLLIRPAASASVVPCKFQGPPDPHGLEDHLRSQSTPVEHVTGVAHLRYRQWQGSGHSTPIPSNAAKSPFRIGEVNSSQKHAWWQPAPRTEAGAEAADNSAGPLHGGKSLTLNTDHLKLAPVRVQWRQLTTSGPSTPGTGGWEQRGSSGRSSNAETQTFVLTSKEGTCPDSNRVPVSAAAAGIHHVQPAIQGMDKSRAWALNTPRSDANGAVNGIPKTPSGCGKTKPDGASRSGSHGQRKVPPASPAEARVGAGSLGMPTMYSQPRFNGLGPPGTPETCWPGQLPPKLSMPLHATSKWDVGEIPLKKKPVTPSTGAENPGMPHEVGVSTSGRMGLEQLGLPHNPSNPNCDMEVLRARISTLIAARQGRIPHVDSGTERGEIGSSTARFESSVHVQGSIPSRRSTSSAALDRMAVRQ